MVSGFMFDLVVIGFLCAVGLLWAEGAAKVVLQGWRWCTSSAAKSKPNIPCPAVGDLRPDSSPVGAATGSVAGPSVMLSYFLLLLRVLGCNACAFAYLSKSFSWVVVPSTVALLSSCVVVVAVRRD